MKESLLFLFLPYTHFQIPYTFSLKKQYLIIDIDASAFVPFFRRKPWRNLHPGDTSGWKERKEMK